MYTGQSVIKLYVILGSTRPNRKSEIVAPWVLAEMKKQADINVELINLRDWPLPFFNEATQITDPEQISLPLAKQWSNKIKQADGFLIITPEYNHGYTAVLKNALDYLYTEWHRKPIAFVSYGGSTGGSRAVEQLRLVALELKMVPVSTAVHLVRFKQELDEQGIPKNPVYGKTLEKLLGDLIWYATTLKVARQSENI